MKWSPSSLPTGAVSARTGGARKSQRVASRVEAREEGFGFVGRGKVIDLVWRRVGLFETGLEVGGEGKERMVSSKVVRDSVGEGGRGIVVVGARLSQGMVSSSLVGVEGGVKSKVEKGCCS